MLHLLNEYPASRGSFLISSGPFNLHCAQNTQTHTHTNSINFQNLLHGMPKIIKNKSNATASFHYVLNIFPMKIGPKEMYIESNGNINLVS